MQKVQDQYLRALKNQLKRRNRQNRDNFSPAENRAILYYGLAVQQLRDLMADTEPVGTADFSGMTDIKHLGVHDG